MARKRSHRLLTEVIALLFLGAGLLASYPFSHCHHDRLPECCCTGDAGHIHSYDKPECDAPCQACQLLAKVGTTENFEFTTVQYEQVLGREFYTTPRPVVPNREAARSPPVDLLHTS
ncbi:hypothetical protein IT157_07550 [bacterium]|nr:hypothetical protein [bacterium]